MDSSDRELALNIKAHRDVLRLFAKDAPGQIAQLIALENFFGVTNPGQIKSVRPNAPSPLVCCWRGSCLVGRVGLHILLCGFEGFSALEISGSQLTMLSCTPSQKSGMAPTFQSQEF